MTIFVVSDGCRTKHQCKYLLTTTSEQKIRDQGIAGFLIDGRCCCFVFVHKAVAACTKSVKLFVLYWFRIHFTNIKTFVYWRHVDSLFRLSVIIE